jgi:AcrR family transcriptional regulator
VKAPERRTRGRPVQDAHPQAREALLDAAVALFAEQGVAATTTAEIAARAGVTPALVHYYFRPRERLLDAVVDERLSRFVMQATRALPGPSAPVVELVNALVDGVFDAAQRMPWMPPLWIREVVSGGGLLRERMIRHLPVSVIAPLVERLAAGKRRGEIAADLEPGFLFLSIAGATMFPLATRALWSKFPGGATLSAAKLRRHAHAMLAGALTAAPRKPSRKPR